MTDAPDSAAADFSGAGGAPAHSAEAAAAASIAPSTSSDTIEQPDERSMIEAAFDRASNKVDAPPDSDDVDGQAAGDDAGDSTPEVAAKRSADDDATGDAASTQGDSTAPADWPEPLRNTYNALPEDAQAGMHKVYTDMQAGFTQAMQQVAAERKQLGPRANELMELASAFDADPQATLETLASQKGLTISFAGAESDKTEVPEFDTAAELAEWAADQAVKRLEASRQQSSGELAAEAQLQEELTAAEKLPGWAEARPQVLELLQRAPSLTVEEAYGIYVFPSLQDQLATARSARQTGDTTLSEARGKRALRPLGSGGGGAAEREFPADLTPTELAYEKAQRKISRRG